MSKNNKKNLDYWIKAAHKAGFKNLDEVKQFQRKYGLKVDGESRF